MGDQENGHLHHELTRPEREIDSVGCGNNSA